MTDSGAPDDERYHVVLNDEEQYSIWPVDQELPPGWRLEGTTGSKADCLSHIDAVWTDMRPLSLRRFMAEHADDVPEPAPDVDDDEPSLVDRLCAGDSPIEVSLRPARTAAALREAIEREYVFIRFTGTRGGTELGVSLDAAGTDLSGADFASSTGTVRLSGTLTLDFEPVRCVARVDLAALTGEGHLERVGDR